MPPLLLACKFGHLSIVRLINELSRHLSYPADMRVRRVGYDSTGLGFATVSEHWDIVEFLLCEAMVEPDNDIITKLHRAVRRHF
eukprot:scaffold505784_cov38-Prasinocladus_malaysianus.AAC.1